MIPHSAVELSCGWFLQFWYLMQGLICLSFHGGAGGNRGDSTFVSFVAFVAFGH